MWIIGNSKQRLKGNSALEIFAENFPCCQKIREARVVYRLKRHLIIYLHAACWVVKIQMAAAVKASHNQLPFIGKAVQNVWKLSPKRSFFYKFREFFRTRTTVPLNIFCDLDGVYSVKMYLENMSKTLPKIFDVCSFYMLKIILLTGTPHNLEFLPRVFPTFDFFC